MRDEELGYKYRKIPISTDIQAPWRGTRPRVASTIDLINHDAFAKSFRCAGRDCCRCSLKAECSKRRCCQPEQVAARTVAVIMGAGHSVAVVCNLVRLVVCCYRCYTVHWITFGSLGQKPVLCVPPIAMLCS